MLFFRGLCKVNLSEEDLPTFRRSEHYSMLIDSEDRKESRAVTATHG